LTEGANCFASFSIKSKSCAKSRKTRLADVEVEVVVVAEEEEEEGDVAPGVGGGGEEEELRTVGGADLPASAVVVGGVVVVVVTVAGFIVDPEVAVTPLATTAEDLFDASIILLSPIVKRSSLPFEANIAGFCRILTLFRTALTNSASRGRSVAISISLT
jgi:hypothetical protein